MPVTVDATGTDAFTSAAGSGTFIYGPTAGVTGTALSNSTGITTTAGATAIAVLIAFQDTTNATPGTTTVKWDPNGTNKTFTLIASGTQVQGANDHESAFIYGLASPGSSGNKPITITTTNSGAFYAEAISFAGTDTTTPFHNGVGAGAANGGVQNPTITVTSPSGEIALGVNSFDSQTMTVGQTSIFNDTAGPDGGGYANRTAGAGSTNLTATGSAASGWSYAAASVQPPVASNPTLNLNWQNPQPVTWYQSITASHTLPTPNPVILMGQIML